MEDHLRIMKFIHGRLKHLNLLLLPALIWLFTNATINTHYHILSNGIKITHAHPYDKNFGEPNPFPDHKHIRGELILLDLISNPLTLVTFTAAGIVLSMNIKIVTSYYMSSCPVREHYYIFNYHAPPLNIL